MDTVLSSAYLTSQQDSTKLAAFLKHSLLASEILQSWFFSCITDYFPVSFSGCFLNSSLTRSVPGGSSWPLFFSCLIHSLHFQYHHRLTMTSYISAYTSSHAPIWLWRCLTGESNIHVQNWALKSLLPPPLIPGWPLAFPTSVSAIMKARDPSLFPHLSYQTH